MYVQSVQTPRPSLSHCFIDKFILVGEEVEQIIKLASIFPEIYIPGL